MTKQKLSFDLGLSNKIFKDNLVSLISVSRDSIVAQETNFQVYIDNLSDKSIGEDWLDNLAHYSNIDWILLNSILLAVFSIFEHHVFALCSIVEERSNSKIKIEDLSGRGIFKYCNYLFLVGEIQNADKTNKAWQEIIYFQKVRNLIAHNGSVMLTDPTKKLENHECYNFLRKYNVTMAGKIGHIRIKDISFIEVFRGLTAEISDKLTKEIAENYKNSR